MRQIVIWISYTLLFRMLIQCVTILLQFSPYVVNTSYECSRKALRTLHHKCFLGENDDATFDCIGVWVATAGPFSPHLAYPDVRYHMIQNIAFLFLRIQTVTVTQTFRSDICSHPRWSRSHHGPYYINFHFSRVTKL